MLNYLTFILVCQLLGELVTKWLEISIPGPVAGMAMLFVFLLVRGQVPSDLASVSDSLLQNLSLLFVPAGVGVMLHFGLLGDQWPPVLAAVLVSTSLTIVITGLAMRWLDRSRHGRNENHGRDD